MLSLVFSRTGHRRIRRIWIWSYTKSIWLWWERMLQKMSFCAEKCSCLFVTVLFLRLLTLKQFWKWNWRRWRPTGNRIQRPDANTWRELNKRSNGQGVSLHFARFVYTRWNFWLSTLSSACTRIKSSGLRSAIVTHVLQKAFFKHALEPVWERTEMIT